MKFVNDKAGCHPLEKVCGPGRYYWCRCGKTAMPPFCDGAHTGSDITPLAFTVDKTKPIAICNCGLTARPPFCDHAHEGDED